MNFPFKIFCRIAIAITIVLLPATTRSAESQSVDSLLQQFELNSNAEIANRFLHVLVQEQFLDSPITFTSQMPLDSMRQQVYYWAGEWLYSQQKYDEARQVAMKALPLFHESNDNRADCLNLLAIIYVRLSDFANAAYYAKRCLDMDMKSGDPDCISSSMNTVAGIYMAANQAKEAEKYIIGAIQHSQQVNNPARQAVILGMASEIYHKLGNDAKALSFAEQAYSIDSLLNRQPQAAMRLSQKGSALLGLKRYKDAEEVLNQALPLLKSNGNQHSYAIALNDMGSAIRQQGRPADAINYYRQAAAIFSGMGDLYNEIHSHRGLYESYWKINADSAKAELDKFNLLKDSLYSHSTAEALSRYNAEFGNEQLQEENKQVRRQHQLTFIFGGLLLVIILAASWLIIRQIRRKHQLKIRRLMAEIENLRLSIQSNPSPEAEEETPKKTEAPGEDTAADDDKVQFLKRVIDAVNSSISKGRISVEQIAIDLNMGEQSFRRRLQSATGETPKAFFTAIQMERAASLLTENPDMAISNVAQLCGFDNISTFGHTFRRMYSCSPSQYRSNIHP